MMKKSHKLIDWVKKNSRLLKIIFLFSILMFIVNQMTGILQGMTWHQLADILFSQRKITLLLMILTGLVAVVPMVTYDWVTVHILEEKGKPKMPRKYLFTSAWTTNTINNLAGFGGVIGATLRTRFYGREIDTKQTVATVSKVALFMLTGLSFLCLVTMGDLFLIHQSHPFRNYWVWLLGGSLVAPALIGFILVNRQKLFKELSNKRILCLFIGSIGQWTGALMTFLVIGYLLGVDVPLLTVYPLFVAATFIGMISMVPGGMGTFDVMMIVGLGSIGISKEFAVAWLLFYRIFYYLVPFLTGIYSFMHQAGAKVNEGLDGIPKMMSQKIAHFILVAMIYFAGIMMVLLSTVPNLSTMSQLFEKMLPLSFNFLDQTLNMLVGFLLLGLARGISQRVKKAYLPTMGLLIFCIINTVTHTFSWQLIVYFMIVMACLFWSRKEFYRSQLVFSQESVAIDGLLYGGLLILYSIVGYYATNAVEHGQPPVDFLLFPSETIWLEGLVGLILAALTIAFLYRYLGGNEPLGEPYQESRMAQLNLANQGKQMMIDHEEPKKLTQFYFVQEGKDQLVFTLERKGSQVGVVGDPIGNLDCLYEASQTLVNQGNDLGYQVIFYGVSTAVAMTLHELGYNFMKIGETGYLKLKNNVADQQLATVSQGQPLTSTDISIISEAEPETILNQLKHLWQQWQVADNSGHQLSYEEVTDLAAQGQFYGAYDQDSHCVGFLIQRAYQFGQTMTYDCLATSEEGPESLADDLLSYGVEMARGKGAVYYLLGDAPLSKVGESKQAFLKERVMYLIYAYSYPMAPLRLNKQFKEKYVTEWEPRYLSYPKNKRSLFLLWQISGLLFTNLTGKAKVFTQLKK